MPDVRDLFEAPLQPDAFLVGVARARSGLSAYCVVIDELGRSVAQTPAPWSGRGLATKLRLVVEEARRTGAYLTVGLEAEALEPEVAEAVLGLGVPSRQLQREVVDCLWTMLRRRDQTLERRARCIAQLLLLEQTPSRPLQVPRAPARTDCALTPWMRSMQQRLMQ